MAQKINRLTPRTVASLDKPGWHADGLGLYLRIEKSGSRRWIYVFQWDKKRAEFGLGSVTAVTLARAREKAAEARALVSEGRNPMHERKALTEAEKPKTFGEVADELIAALEPGWKNPKHIAQWKMTMTVYAKPLRSRPVVEIDTAAVLAVLKPMWQRVGETASRTRNRIERVLDYAGARGYRPENLANPARWRGHLALLLPARPEYSRGHHAALPYEEIAEFMVDLRTRPATAARALEFLILTATRTNETLGARRREFDLERKVWTVPPERMKGKKGHKREHQVPLTEAMIAVLEAMCIRDLAPADLVFPGQKVGCPLSNMSMTMLLRRMERGAITAHGFRSTFRDWAGDCTSFPEEIAEQALAHVVGSKVRRAYRRGDALAKRRDLMTAWSTYVAGADNVVRLAATA